MDPRLQQVSAHVDGSHPEPAAHIPECPICAWFIENQQKHGKDWSPYDEQPVEVLSWDRYAVQA